MICASICGTRTSRWRNKTRSWQSRKPLYSELPRDVLEGLFDAPRPKQLVFGDGTPDCLEVDIIGCRPNALIKGEVCLPVADVTHKIEPFEVNCERYQRDGALFYISVGEPIGEEQLLGINQQHQQVARNSYKCRTLTTPVAHESRTSRTNYTDNRTKNQRMTLECHIGLPVMSPSSSSSGYDVALWPRQPRFDSWPGQCGLFKFSSLYLQFPPCIWAAGVVWGRR